MRSLTLIILVTSVLLVIVSCVQPCKEAKTNARTYTKDTALMYLWQNVDKKVSDYYYFSFKPDGDLGTGDSLKQFQYIQVWYTSNDIIKEVFCYETGSTGTDDAYKYLIKNDTLFLFPSYSSGGQGVYLDVPRVFTKVSKYQR